MRPFSLIVPEHQSRIGLLALLAGLFPLAAKRRDGRDLPAHLRRDIGLDEPQSRNWERLLR